MKVGVLALQGAFARHAAVLRSLDVAIAEVRTIEDLDAVDALVIPGGESTTMSMMLERSGLLEPLSRRLEAGMAVFGTCAGAILLAAEVLDGRDDQRHLGAIDISVRRNSWGRQIDSFEAEVSFAGDGDPAAPLRRCSFIRAPRIIRVGPDVIVEATLDGEPVLVRQGAVLASTFHPELGADPRVHQQFLALL